MARAKWSERSCWALYPFREPTLVTGAPRNGLPGGIKKAMQFINGGYSYRVRKELRFAFEIWQRSFTVHRIMNAGDYQRHRSDIHQNPVADRLVAKAENWEYSSASGAVRLDPPPEYLRG